jgi:hypothetical protein
MEPSFDQQQPASMLWLAAIWIFIVAVKSVEVGIEAWNVIRRGEIDKHVPEYVGQVTGIGIGSGIVWETCFLGGV